MAKNTEKKNDQHLLSDVAKILENAESLFLALQNQLQRGLPARKENLSKFKSLHLLKKSKEFFEKETAEYEVLLNETLNDKERELLEKEIDLLNEKKKEIDSKAIKIIVEEENIKNNCIVEIRPGAGGIEAGLFARDLYQMYYKFAENKSWKVEVTESRADSLGNFSFISFLVKGNEAFSWLKNESGVHRVQRVPITESKGRLQTSTVSVVVLPEVSEIDARIENKDLRIDTYRSSGAGGQHVNTTDSAIRITHIPTGITAVSQSGRSQHDNKEKAMLIIRSRLFEKQKNDQEKKLGNIRTSAIGSSERAEKIRTYNYPQNRVTDHRINLTINKLNSIIEGEIEELCKNLMIFELEKNLADFINDTKIEKIV